ncbi:Uncharacterized protein APZ42_002906 [Daphnia magna]|uniref:Uncharacterized protein n=1 Tax=Daphnia magna TaxID=35525 RepID=A0A0N8DMQ0_9CRUS|nr:Uncharacterized protein APZ42_002906 [Daphnia magna]
MVKRESSMNICRIIYFVYLYLQGILLTSFSFTCGKNILSGRIGSQLTRCFTILNEFITKNFLLAVLSRFSSFIQFNFEVNTEKEKFFIIFSSI